MSNQKIDPSALFSIGYGLYVVTSQLDGRDNGFVCNTVAQVTNSPVRLTVAVNKGNWSHDIIKQTGVLNVNCLSETAPFSVFENFGFRSGRDADKLSGVEFFRSENGIAVLSKNISAFISLKVTDYIDFGSHGMFVCEVTESAQLSKTPAMSYTFYHKNVKPKPQPTAAKGWRCKICGYVYEGEELPADFECPLCGHPASDFERIE